MQTFSNPLDENTKIAREKLKMEIFNYQDLIDNPNVIAQFDVYIPALQMTICRFKVIKTNKGQMFINIPSWCEKLQDGTRKFHPYIMFSEEKGKEFQKEVKVLLKNFLPLGEV